MKSIHLKEFTTEQHHSIVSLGPGRRIQFTTKKAAAHFLVETNRFLTVQLVELNELYACLFLHYRRTWMGFHHQGSQSGISLVEMERKTKMNLLSADEKFDYLIHYRSNNPYMTMVDLEKICFFLGEAAKGLEGISGRRFNALETRILEGYRFRILRTQELITDWGAEKKAPA